MLCMAPGEGGAGGRVEGTLLTHRVVMIGCGAMSHGWLRAVADHPDLAERIRVVGLVDLDAGRAGELAAEFGLADPVIGTDLEAVLAQTRPDLVFDIVVPPARAAVVRAALRHGAHVLSEKPMAASMAEARELVEASREAGRIHAVIQNRRYHPGMRRIRRLIDAGALGELTAVHCDFFIGAHFGGFRDEMQHVLLLDMAIHTFDATRFVIGSRPLAVYCHETNPKGSWYAHGAAANAIFEFEEDVVATYRGSWSAEGANTSWESLWRIVGTRGTLLWDGAEGFEANIVTGTEGFLRETAPVAVPDFEDASQTEGHASVIRAFVDAVETGAQPETAGHDNIASLAMVFGAIESAEAGRRVEIQT
jgi:predicted dehydrogenase